MKQTWRRFAAVLTALLLVTALSASALAAPAAGYCALDHHHTAHCAGGGCYGSRSCHWYGSYPAKEVFVPQGQLSRTFQAAAQPLTAAENQSAPAPAYACPFGADCPYGGVCDQDGVCIYGGDTCIPCPNPVQTGRHHGGGHHGGGHHGWGG